MAQSQRPASTLQELCSEAVARCGDDWQRIERYVAVALCELPLDRREALLQDISRILRYRPPPDAGMPRDRQ